MLIVGIIDLAVELDSHIEPSILVCPAEDLTLVVS